MKKLHAILAIMALLATASLAQADGLADMNRFYKKVHSLSADFVQTQMDEQDEVFSTLKGRFLLKRPDQFRWAYKKPDEQIIVSDGKTFKFYDVGLSQVTIQDGANSLQATPARLLTGQVGLEKSFKVKQLAHKDGKSWLELTPKSKDSDFTAIRLGLKDGMPVVMELDDHLGQKTKIVFKNIKVDPKLPAKSFDIDIPDDVTVVDNR